MQIKDWVTSSLDILNAGKASSASRALPFKDWVGLLTMLQMPRKTHLTRDCWRLEFTFNMRLETMIYV